MSESLHDYARMRALDDQQRCASMPEIMKPLLPQAGALQDLPEATRDIAAVQGSAERRRKDQSPSVLPGRTNGQSLLGLRGTMSP